MQRIKYYLFPVMLLLLIAVCYGKHFFYIGFLSDDWELLGSAATSSLWQPLEAHHFSLLINLAFKGASLGWLSPLAIHLGVMLFHIANCWLVYRIVRYGLGEPELAGQGAACLFALNAAGSEAMFWCCAMGYVICTFWILIALDRFIAAITTPSSSLLKHGALFALLQAAAFLSWDWGAVLLPFLGATALFLPGIALPARYRACLMLVPVAVLWVGILGGKSLIGQSLGYAINTPYQMLVNVISAPVVTLLPQFSKAFYASIPGIAITLALLGMLAYLCFTRPLVRLLTAFYVICITPPMLLGYPQSRYFYLSSFPFYTIIACTICQWKAQDLKRATLGILIGFNVFWTYQRGTWWGEASALSASIKESIAEAASTETRPMVIVNLPDRHNTQSAIWMPFVWRCGSSTIAPGLTLVDTPDCSGLNITRGIPILSRDDIKKKYDRHAIYEISIHKTPDGPRSELVKLL